MLTTQGNQELRTREFTVLPMQPATNSKVSSEDSQTSSDQRKTKTGRATRSRRKSPQKTAQKDSGQAGYVELTHKNATYKIATTTLYQLEQAGWQIADPDPKGGKVDAPAATASSKTGTVCSAFFSEDGAPRSLDSELYGGTGSVYEQWCHRLAMWLNTKGGLQGMRAVVAAKLEGEKPEHRYRVALVRTDSKLPATDRKNKS